MKKSISWLQRKYVGSYLLYLETQGETFHVTFHGFQRKYITSFVASTFAVHFLQKVFMKALNVLFSICQKKSPPTQVIHCPCMTFSMEKIRSSVPWQWLCQHKQVFYDVLRFLCPKILWHLYWRQLYEIILGAK